MRHLWMCMGLLGCISPGIRVQQDSGSGTIDTGDTADLLDTEDTMDTQETDTEDTEDPEDLEHDDEMTDIGLREMSQEYLWFKGDMALEMDTRDEGGGDLNEFDMILNPGKKWGVGVTLAPFNQQSKDVLFGGQEVELFSGHGRVMTMQITETDDQRQDLSFDCTMFRLSQTMGIRCCVQYESLHPVLWTQNHSLQTCLMASKSW